MTSISITRTPDAGRWDEFVASSPAATGYHSWAWRQVFERAFGHRTEYLAAEDDGRIVGVLPLVLFDSWVFGRFAVSLPFVNYGGVVADREDVAGQLVEAAVAVAREAHLDHVELRHTARRFPAVRCKQHKVAMHLRLAPDAWDRLDRKVRNQIRKAQKSELIAEAGGPELLEAFYAVFARNMRDLGTPVLGRHFFAQVLETFPDRARLHIVRRHGQPIAGGLTYRTRDVIEVQWASSVRDYNSLCPNHLLYWSIVEHAVATGSRVLDFGRSTPHEGTFKFKEQWGAEPVPLHWEYPLVSGEALPNASPSNPKFKLAIEVWRHLPLAIANRVGPSIVRTIP